MLNHSALRPKRRPFLCAKWIALILHKRRKKVSKVCHWLKVTSGTIVSFFIHIVVELYIPRTGNKFIMLYTTLYSIEIGNRDVWSARPQLTPTSTVFNPFLWLRIFSKKKLCYLLRLFKKQVGTPTKARAGFTLRLWDKR